MLGKSLFGLGGSSESNSSPAPAPASNDQPSPSPLASQLPPATSATSPSSSSPMSAIGSGPMTVDSILANVSSADTSKLNPASYDDVELLYIADNPFALQSEHRPTGTFGPLPMRTGFDKLLYGCGTAYLGGLVTGGGYGFIRGLQTAQVPAFKVRMNSVLNQVTRYGPRSANTMGVLSMSWAVLDNGLEYVRDKSDYVNHIGAAFLSGAIFKSTAGLRPALFTGILLSSIVGMYGLWDKISTDGLQLPSFKRAEPAAA
ncbi:Mitochondrial import inner membrane translocase subunit tim23 [Borealophlyctis nickersoniae]|nr:Mitochondrial import inner membrane translocase subunit tim23 [Borealophlyctis nickersoniae]